MDVGERALALAAEMVEELGPRPAGSEAAERAQRWVEAELRARGWSPERVAGGVPEGTVLACRAGRSERAVLFLAHTDSVHGRVVGANDNAAAVASLLVLAEDLRWETPRTVCLGFPGGEEVGLLGATAVARLGLPVDQVMALDLVGRGRVTHNGLGAPWSAGALRALLAAAPADVPWVYRALSHAWPHMERSDHRPFTQRGVPASHLMARAESGVYLAYHSVDDRADQLDPRTLADVQGVLRGVASMEPLPAGRSGPAFVLPFTSIVVGGEASIFASVAAAFTAGFAVIGPRPAVRGVLAAMSGPLLCALAATAAVLLAATGRPLDGALAPWAVASGWLAWAAVASALPVDGELARRLGALGSLVLAAVALWAGLSLLALPCLVAGAALALPGPLRLLSAWPALYLLRADAVRELAFHGLVPAEPWVWGILWAALGVPLYGAVASLGVRDRRVPAALALAAVALALAAWAVDPHAAPFVRRERLWPGA